MCANFDVHSHLKKVSVTPVSKPRKGFTISPFANEHFKEVGISEDMFELILKDLVYRLLHALTWNSLCSQLPQENQM